MQRLAIISILWLCIGCSIHYRTDKFKTSTKWTKEKQSDDLKYFNALMQEVHPEPYFFSTKDSIQKAEARLFSSDSKNRIEFYLRFLRLLSIYNNGHISTFFPFEEFNESLKKDSIKIFPYSISVSRKSVYIQKNNIQENLISINGYKVDSLISDWRNYYGGLDNYRNKNLSKEFFFLLWANGINAPYKVVTSNGSFYTNGKSGTVIKSPSEILSKENTSSEVNKQLFEFKMIDSNIAYINYKAMFLEKETSEFFANTFKTIKENNAKGVIIDLRENAGGQSRFGRMLLDYVNGKPYKISGGKTWKVSKSFKLSFKKFLPWALRWLPIQMFNAGFKPYWKAREGSFLKDSGNWVYPGENPLRFKGKVVFLTGAGTFSSAMMLANAVKDFNLATIIGTPTGECPNDFGEIAYFQLPNSKITFALPSAKFKRANGDEKDTRAVLPDIMTEGLSAKETLEAAIKFIKENR